MSSYEYLIELKRMNDLTKSLNQEAKIYEFSTKLSNLLCEYDDPEIWDTLAFIMLEESVSTLYCNDVRDETHEALDKLIDRRLKIAKENALKEHP